MSELTLNGKQSYTIHFGLLLLALCCTTLALELEIYGIKMMADGINERPNMNIPNTTIAH